MGALYRRAWDEIVAPPYPVEAAFGLPPDWHSYALIPIGYPVGRFGPVRRVALEDVVHEDRWGQPYGAAQ